MEDPTAICHGQLLPGWLLWRYWLVVAWWWSWPLASSRSRRTYAAVMLAVVCSVLGIAWLRGVDLRVWAPAVTVAAALGVLAIQAWVLQRAHARRPGAGYWWACQGTRWAALTVVACTDGRVGVQVASMVSVGSWRRAVNPPRDGRMRTSATSPSLGWLLLNQVARDADARHQQLRLQPRTLALAEDYLEAGFRPERADELEVSPSWMEREPRQSSDASA